MLKIRVIPTLLWKNVGLVKGISFDSWRRVGTVLPAVKVYNTRDVDELVLLDIQATLEGREPDYESLVDIASECFVPLTVGGGVRSVGIVRELLRSGADKVCVNTAAYENPSLVREIADRFGSQCAVVGIDARRESDGSYACYSRCGSTKTGWKAEDWAARMEEEGAGEILLTSIERDGTMLGYDLDLVRRVSERVSIPVIASGGAGGYAHMADVLKETKASAVAAASIYHFTEQTPAEAKRFLRERGFSVRV